MKLTTLINKFEIAAVDYSWIGSLNPEEHDEIIREYRKWKKALKNFKAEETPTKTKNVRPVHRVRTDKTPRKLRVVRRVSKKRKNTQK